MGEREGSWWSRAWGGVAVVAFALGLGAAAFEAAVVAPLWSLAPPASVAAWATLKTRPDSSLFFHPVVAIIAFATSLAWISGLTARGSRRWWLTLALLAAGAVGAVTVAQIIPCERDLFGAAALGDRDAAAVVALTGDWVRAAALRLGALLVGAWAAYRAQLAGMAGSRRVAIQNEEEAPPRGRRPARARPEFSFGDEGEPEVTLGDEAPNPRQRWQGSLPGRRRTAKK